MDDANRISLSTNQKMALSCLFGMGVVVSSLCLHRYISSLKSPSSSSSSLSSSSPLSPPLASPSRKRAPREPSPSLPVAHVVFWDLETTIPSAAGEPQEIIEFGALLVDPLSLRELSSFSSLLRSSLISQRSIDCNHITPAMVADAPSFADLAPRIFALLHGQVWAGHNLLAFDVPVLDRAFAQIGAEPPRPLCVVDTLVYLRHRMPRASVGNHKLATLGLRYGQGVEAHRSLDDCRMNLEVMRSAAMAIALQRDYGIVASADGAVRLHPDQLKAFTKSPLPAGCAPSAEKQESAEFSAGGTSKGISSNSSTLSSSSSTSTSTSTSTSSSASRGAVVPPPNPQIVEMLDAAIASGSKVWIIYSYDPKKVRCILPTGWNQKPTKLVAMDDGKQKFFMSGRILELRSEQWQPE